MSLWSLGSTVIILLAALRNVPNELYEALNIDGANGWTQFIRITVPVDQRHAVFRSDRQHD